MPKRRKTFVEECESLLKRHDSLASRTKGRLRVYVASLLERFSSMDYSLSELQRLIGLATQPTTENYDPFENYKQKRDFYADCFWSFSYSVFDILSHILNTLHPAVKDESKVSFVRAGQGYQSLSKEARGKAELPEKLRTKIATITNRNYFKRLAAYRQCCLHRRAVCVGEESTRVSLSIPHAASTAKNEPKIITWICDDPDDMVPKFKKKRGLEDECAEIRTGIVEDVRQLIRVL